MHCEKTCVLALISPCLEIIFLHWLCWLFTTTCWPMEWCVTIRQLIQDILNKSTLFHEKRSSQAKWNWVYSNKKETLLFSAFLNDHLKEHLATVFSTHWCFYMLSSGPSKVPSLHRHRLFLPGSQDVWGGRGEHKQHEHTVRQQKLTCSKIVWEVLRCAHVAEVCC